MRSGSRSAFAGATRAADGLIATVVDLETGALDTLSARGLIARREKIDGKRRGRERIEIGITDLLRALADELDSRPGEWRVRTLSSPTTILRDLQGARTVRPEPILLGRIGRIDLLAERNVRHGTLSGYNYFRCRCPLCKRANTEAQADWKARVRARADGVAAHPAEPDAEGQL